jgi:hypothetical protein
MDNVGDPRSSRAGDCDTAEPSASRTIGFPPPRVGDPPPIWRGSSWWREGLEPSISGDGQLPIEEQSMKAIRKRLPSPAMVVACASLVIALGGVSYAAGVLPNNSVGAAQLQKKAVTGAKLRNGAVTGAKVRDRSLMAADFKAGQLPAGPQGPKGDTGPKGDPGIQGPKGEKGDAGATNVTKRSATGPSVGLGLFSTAVASCQAGETLVGGGAAYVDAGQFSSNPTLTWSGPAQNSESSWRVSYRNDDVPTMRAISYALCATP